MDGVADDVDEENGRANGDMAEKNEKEQWKYALVEVAVYREKNKRKNVKKHETNQLYAMEWEYVRRMHVEMTWRDWGQWKS